MSSCIGERQSQSRAEAGDASAVCPERWSDAAARDGGLDVKKENVDNTIKHSGSSNLIIIIINI